MPEFGTFFSIAINKDYDKLKRKLQYLKLDYMGRKIDNSVSFLFVDS